MTGAVRWLTCDRADLPDGLDWLAPDERDRLAAMRFAPRRDNFLLGRWTAKRVLAARLPGAAPAAIEIRAAADGAPEAFFDGAPLPVTLSISHRAGRGLAAVGDAGAALGADVEWIEPRSALLVADFFTADEAAAVAACPPAGRDRAIALYWSAKESALKARRTGLREDPRAVRVEADGLTAPSDGAWRALRIAVDGTPGTLAGWWRDDAGYVVTIAGAAVADEPSCVASCAIGAGLYDRRMPAVAWVLDVMHRVRRFEIDVPPGDRALVATERVVHRELGVTLGLPLGVRGLDRAPELLFLLPGGAHEPSFTPLPAFAADDERGFSLYVEAMLGGWSPPTRELDVFYFGDTPELAAQLAHLVMKGVKRGTVCWLAAMARLGFPPAHPGMVSVVTDRFGHALCVIEFDRVEQLRFGDVGERHAWVEGEGDRTLAAWRAGHLSYYTAEAARLGLEFSDDALVLFQYFRVLKVLGRADD